MLKLESIYNMPGSCNDVTERLYLQKNASGDISVPCSDLTQHQIDGVRFLFSQYTKKKLGAILNYPPGCGNSVQVALFISAISEKLSNPVLILYDSDAEKEAWISRFAKWTTFDEDSIAVDTTNIYVRKQIFITNIADISKLYRRQWDIVIVKSDNFKSVFRKCQLKVNFKIWITAQDLKKDEELLHSVYTWINPSDQFLKQYLSINSPANIKKEGRNELILDMLLEDILFTRRGLMPFGTHKRKRDLEVQPVLRVSKKNKDATGTKIKRSKKQKEVPSISTISIENNSSFHDNDNSFETSIVPTKNSNGNDATANNFTIDVEGIDNDDEGSKMDVESFIRDNDPLQSDMNLNFAISNLDSTIQTKRTSSPNAGEVFTESSLNFNDAVADIIHIENDVPTEISDDSNLNVEAKDKVCDVTQGVTVAEDVEVEGSTVLSQIDLSKPVFQKIFFISSQEKCSDFEPVEKTGEAKTEKDLEGERNGVADQESKLEVSTSVKKETDNNFDSKLKELEERAVRKFKGSFLDNIFKC